MFSIDIRDELRRERETELTEKVLFEVVRLFESLGYDVPRISFTSNLHVKMRDFLHHHFNNFGIASMNNTKHSFRIEALEGNLK
jgi:hypothetical protein